MLHTKTNFYKETWSNGGLQQISPKKKKKFSLVIFISNELLSAATRLSHWVELENQISFAVKLSQLCKQIIQTSFAKWIKIQLKRMIHQTSLMSSYVCAKVDVKENDNKILVLKCSLMDQIKYIFMLLLYPYRKSPFIVTACQKLSKSSEFILLRVSKWYLYVKYHFH